SRLHEMAGSPDAYTYARTAYELAKKNDDEYLLLQACDLLIGSFLATDTAQCRILLQEALNTAVERDKATDRATFHDRYGRFEMRLRHWDEAFKQLQQGLDVLGFKLSADTDGPMGKRAKPLAELLLDMGRCYKGKGDPEQALNYLLACERTIANTSMGLPVFPEPDIGELYLAQGNTPKALQYGRAALARADEEGNKENLDLERRATLLMYKVLKDQGDSKGALAMHERWTNAMGSRRDEDFKLGLQRKQLTEAFTKKEAEMLEANVRREVERENKEKEREARTWYFVIGGTILFLGAAVVVFIDRRRRLARFEKEAAQLETQALRSQMNPHFIFNALNSINAFVQQNEPDKAASYLSRFARLMRLVLENSRQSEVPLKDDLDALDAYLHLERTRTGEKFDYRIEVAEDIDPEDVMVPPLVAQPFVENAIWHGMSGKEERGLITLSVSRKGDQLLFAIEDDGVGRNSPKRMASMGAPDPGKGGKKTSLGTAITKARLDLVRQQKGKDAGFIYVDLPQGTRVELTLPFSSAL
ncbi:MAG TPA: histidine kinase, partial [Flavobacteriales bacterium]|nr:histidine kinase [Flavobacteriales bacterium]